MRLLLVCVAVAAVLALVLALRGAPDAGPPALSRTSAPGPATAAPRAAPAPPDRVRAAALGAAAAPGAGAEAPGPLAAPGAPVDVAGRVAVNGAPPGYPLRVVLRTDVPAVTARRRARGAADAERVRAAWSTRTDAAGGFGFADVPGDWGGALVVSSLEDLPLEGACTLELEAPRPWVELALSAPPVVRGRVLDAATRAPVAELRLELGTGAGGVSKSAVTWSDGSFRAGVPVPDAVDAPTGWLRERAAPLAPGLTVERFAIDPARGADLGELLVARTRPVELVVRDATGAPVPGARIGLEGIEPDAARTDAEGRAVVQAFASIRPRLEVAAEGFEPRTVRPPFERRAPARRLESELEFRFGPDGELLPGADAAPGPFEVVLQAAPPPR